MKIKYEEDGITIDPVKIKTGTVFRGRMCEDDPVSVYLLSGGGSGRTIVNLGNPVDSWVLIVARPLKIYNYKEIDAMVIVSDKK